MNVRLLNRQTSTLLIIDVQDKLLPAIATGSDVVTTIQFLQQAAAVLAIPVAISEQYPQGLGHTVATIRDASPAAEIFEKLRFSAANEFAAAVPLDRHQVVLCGIESHICVLQTALELQHTGYEVSVVEDAIGSRHEADHHNALTRLQHQGVNVCRAESVVFEWCERAGTDDFRAISRMVRERSDRRSADDAS